jgi:hypothetical protein
MIALFAIGCLTMLGYFKGTDVAMSIASIAISIGAANAYQGKKEAVPSPAP